ncbi:acyltransferase family protein [Streptomyces erythrochromogenes]|uniref:acyltransferase family protein n=1 Tax=Streptomyces erythrochromogenes TaxID=285574 RepID=UPI003687D440
MPGTTSLTKDIETPPVQRQVSRLPAGTAGLLALIPAAVLATGWTLASGTGQPLLFRGGMLLHSAAEAALIALVAHAPGGPLGQVLGCRPAAALGGLSYGFHLWHWPVILLLDAAGPAFHGWARTAWLGGICLAAATLSKKLVEDPLRYKARWAHGRSGALALLASVLTLAALWPALTGLLPDSPPVVDVTRLPAPRVLR